MPGTSFLFENDPVFLFLTCVFLIYISLSVIVSKLIFVRQSGIECNFGGFLAPSCPLMPQRYHARIVFLEKLEIGDVHA